VPGARSVESVEAYNKAERITRLAGLRGKYRSANVNVPLKNAGESGAIRASVSIRIVTNVSVRHIANPDAWHAPCRYLGDDSLKSGDDMTFLQSDIVEFEEVRQRHDAFVELGRLELMAEELRTHGNAEQLSSIEHHIQELGSTLKA